MTVPTSTDIASSKGGVTYTLLYSDVDVDQVIIFDVNNWDQGQLTNLSTAPRLAPETDEGGTWLNAIPLESLTDESKGINFTWIGEGVTLDYSLDNTTWTPVGNRRTILEDLDTTGIFLVIRATLADENSYLDQIRLDLLGDRVMRAFSGTRDLHFKGTAMDQTYEHQLDFVDDSGAFIQNGWIEIQPDPTEEALNAASIELWARTDDPGNVSHLGQGIVYKNGELYADTAFPDNDWAHWVVVLDSPHNNAIRIGEGLDMTVGHLAVYSQSFSADDAAQLYTVNVGVPTFTVVDDDEIVVSEDATPVDIYAYTWSVVSSG